MNSNFHNFSFLLLRCAPFSYNGSLKEKMSKAKAPQSVQNRGINSFPFSSSLVETSCLTTSVPVNPISYGGGALEAPSPNRIGDCSKMYLYIDLKVLDFSYISKTKILKKKKNLIFLPHPPSEGGTKKMKILKGGRRA